MNFQCQSMRFIRVHGKKDFKGPDDEDGFYDYKRMAKELVAYVKDMGYTHVELMGILEHPLMVRGDIRLWDIMHLHQDMEHLRILCIW